MKIHIVLLALLLCFVVNTQEDENVYTDDAEIREATPAANSQQVPQSQPTVQEPLNSETPKQQPLAADKVQQHQDYNPYHQVPLHEKYLYEIVFITLIIMILLNYRAGKRMNEVIVDKWLRTVEDILTQNFAHIGFAEESGKAIFLEESAHEYLLYASGRQNLVSLEANFELRKRQDLLTYYLLELVFPEKDLLTIDIPINNTVPLVFCLAKKKQMKNLKEKCPDLTHMTKNFEVNNLQEPFKLLAENWETVEGIFDGYVVKTLNQLQQVVYSIHYTDQKMFSNSTGHLRVVLSPMATQGQKNEMAMKLILHIVDRIATFKLPQAARAKAEKSREIFAASKEKAELQKKQEELQKLKAEKRRQEELRIKSLPPEKQRRALEKEAKKEMNKRYRGRVMKM